jgi:hypothetical protein
VKEFIRPAPAYQIYPSNIMSNINWRTMSLEQRGLMITLQFECWVNGSVPSNPQILAKLLLIGDSSLKDLLSNEVMSFFDIRDEKIVCPELAAYKYILDQRRSKQSEGGKKGQTMKKNKQLDDEEFENYSKRDIEGQPQGQPQGQPSREPEGSLVENRREENTIIGLDEVHSDVSEEFAEAINSTSRYM